MKLRNVKPESIKVPEVRVTGRWDEETMAAFRQVWHDVGQIAPIICVEVDGELILVDGMHRLTEALNSRMPTIAVSVVEGDMTDVPSRNLFLDHLRGKHPVSEMVKVVEALWKEYQMDSDAIARKIGRSREYVENLMLIAGLTPMIREALDQDMIGVGQAVALARVKDPVQQETIFHQAIMYRWKAKELTAFITDVLSMEPPPPPQPGATPPPAPVKVKCVYCGAEGLPGEIANPNTCRDCAGVMFQSMALARQQAAQEAAAVVANSHPQNEVKQETDTPAGGV